MNIEEAERFSAHRRHWVIAYLGSVGPAPAPGRQVDLASGTIIKQINRRANPSVSDAVAKLADPPRPGKISGEIFQLPSKSRFRSTALSNFATGKLPEMRQEAFGGAVVEQNLALMTNNC
jgi:hypothetical protein